MKAKGKKEVGIDLYLSMTEREARVLVEILERVGGDINGPRSVANKIRQEVAALLIVSKHTLRDFGSIHLPRTWDEFEGASE